MELVSLLFGKATFETHYIATVKRSARLCLTYFLLGTFFFKSPLHHICAAVPQLTTSS
jgi:hypothetical protein